MFSEEFPHSELRLPGKVLAECFAAFAVFLPGLGSETLVLCDPEAFKLRFPCPLVPKAFFPHFGVGSEYPDLEIQSLFGTSWSTSQGTGFHGTTDWFGFDSLNSPFGSLLHFGQRTACQIARLSCPVGNQLPILLPQPWPSQRVFRLVLHGVTRGFPELSLPRFEAVLELSGMVVLDLPPMSRCDPGVSKPWEFPPFWSVDSLARAALSNYEPVSDSASSVLAESARFSAGLPRGVE